MKKRSTEQGFKNSSPAFIDLKRGLTGQLGAGHFHQGSSHAGLVAVLRFSDVPLLRPRAPPPVPTRTRTLGFRFPRPQNCSPPPPAPSPRRHLGKVVLLTSFFTSVRSSSVRDGAVGSMAEAGDGASSGSRSSGCAAPPRLRASAFEWRGRREAERVGRERAAPSRTDGLVSQTVPLRQSRGRIRLTCPQAEFGAPDPSLSRRPRSRHRPSGGHRESPPSLYSSQSEPACGTPLSPPPAGAFQEWLHPQPPERQRVAAGWPPRKESFPWVGYVAALPACGRRLRRQFTGGVGSLLICTLWFLPFSQTLSNDFCCCLLPRFKTIWSDTDMRAYT